MAPAVELSDYERKRQETIAKNQALLRNLALDAAEAGIAPSRKKSHAASKPTKKKTIVKIKGEDGPRRTSSRLKGIVADSEVAKRKADDESLALQQAERAKRQRISGDLNLSDILVSGKSWDQSGNFLTVGPARPYERTFTATDVKTGDKELRALREKMSNLQLWEGVEPGRIKITPERVYSMAFHPSAEKALVFAGDKLGNLGIFDGSQDVKGIKSEDDEDEDKDEWEPSITTLKPHSRTISAMHFAGDSLYMASYDSAIRKLDLNKGIAMEVYAPADSQDDEPLSGVQIPENEPHMLYFSTLSGAVGRYDMRADSRKNPTALFQLSEKKIGGFTLHPTHPHLIATASLDRTMRIWDLRKLNGSGVNKVPNLVGEHESRLSVSHAAWNYAGQVATSSYDDTVKIYNFSGCGAWDLGKELKEAEMKPKTVVPHNNQTGRWVTILRPQWQMQPSDGVQRFCIGNMNRFVDIYTAKGEQLAQLGGEGITAVPAVAQFHPSCDWVAAATASGKLCLWM
ncbi:WD40 repeat-like protein [Tothia fuscella]|uniref:DNA damage-binding protein CMR1 n=1 Tax=Tothia fuscella TaxID=1048955 RepID=A0A9P4NE04_9PEZI|nr:WD40 repeat-like protein [Tothia fuscella]